MEIKRMRLYTTKEKETGFPGPQTGLFLRPTGLLTGHKQDKHNVHLAEATGRFCLLSGPISNY